MEPELWLRLGELYMRRSKTDRFFEIVRENDGLVKIAPKLVKNASSRSSVTEAIKVYDKIEKAFQNKDTTILGGVCYALTKYNYAEWISINEIQRGDIVQYWNNSGFINGHCGVFSHFEHGRKRPR